MNRFEIIGGKRLSGEIIPQGAKNEALQILCAVLLTPEKVTISNIPDIVDVNKLIELLASLGVQVVKLSEGTFSFQANQVDVDFLISEEFKKKGAALRG
jgi:UDP-N-acetylglucosamine 1-carboxyvinyltransferase